MWSSASGLGRGADSEPGAAAKAEETKFRPLVNLSDRHTHTPPVSSPQPSLSRAVPARLALCSACSPIRTSGSPNALPPPPSGSLNLSQSFRPPPSAVSGVSGRGEFQSREGRRRIPMKDGTGPRWVTAETGEGRTGPEMTWEDWLPVPVSVVSRA